MAELLLDCNEVEKRKFFKIPNWRHYLLKICAKRKKNYQHHWQWLNKTFRNASKPWKWFRSKEIEFRTSWSRRRRFCRMSRVGPMLKSLSRHTWESWNGRSYLSRRTLQTDIFFDQWHTGWIISIFAFLKKSKNGSISGWPQKMHRFSRWYYTPNNFKFFLKKFCSGIKKIIIIMEWRNFEKFNFNKFRKNIKNNNQVLLKVIETSLFEIQIVVQNCYFSINNYLNMKISIK